MAELKKYLDQAGLQVLWNAAKAKFIDDTELAAALANYETIEDLQNDYYNKTEVNTLINNLASVYATKTELTTGLNKKTDKEVVGANGTAQIFNESDGGGAHFIHTDGSESFVGVNDGGKDGMMAQIYADQVIDGAWVGSRINVYHNGIYYVSKANQLAGYAKNAAAMEIATKKDIQDLGSVLHFVGIATKQGTETEIEAVERTFPAAQQTAGAVAICGVKEFICCGSPLAWVEFGDVSAYATKAELQAEASTRATDDATLQANINAEATERANADAALQTGKLNVMPGNEQSGGNPYNLPYYFYTVPSATKVEVHTKTRTLDGNDVYGDYSLDVAGASTTAAGLMVATDKEKLDNISTLTQAEIEEICK